MGVPATLKRHFLRPVKCGWLLLAKRSCADWAVASEEYRENLKKLYAELEEPAVWGGSRSG